MTDTLLTRLLGRAVSLTVLTALVGIPICFLIVAVTYLRLYPGIVSPGDLCWVLPGILWSVGLFGAARRRPGWFGPRLLVASFIAANLAMGAVILTACTVPVSDPLAIWMTAERMSDGSFDAFTVPQGYYLNMFNWKLGIAAFEALVMKAFGPRMIVFQLLALLIINLSGIMTYVMSRRYLGRVAAVAATVAFMTFYPVLVTVGQFCDQQLAVPLLIGILLLLDSDSPWRWCAAGGMIALLDFVRPIGVLLLITAAVWLLMRHRPLRRSLALGAGFALCYVAVMSSLNCAMIHARWADSPVNSAKLPYFKFDRGLTGFYGAIDLEGRTLRDFSLEERQRVVDHLVHRPGFVARYVVTKMIRYEGEFDYRMENTYNHDAALWNRTPVKQQIMAGWGQYVALGVIGSLGLAAMLRRRRPVMAPWMIFYAGNFAVYFFIEAFTGYRYEGYPFLMLLAAMWVESGAAVLKNH